MVPPFLLGSLGLLLPFSLQCQHSSPLSKSWGGNRWDRGGLKTSSQVPGEPSVPFADLKSCLFIGQWCTNLNVLRIVESSLAHG